MIRGSVKTHTAVMTEPLSYQKAGINAGCSNIVNMLDIEKRR